MQVTQADSTNIRSVGVEEDIIRFRPSPNFKNMKKFLKNRSDYTETTSMASSSHVVADPVPPQLVEVKPVVVQPPLPPYPPPPDSPLDINITIKQERQDVEPPVNTGEDSSEAANQEQLPTEAEQLEEKPKKTMCKEFIRGDCKRSVCRFSHEIDISQLRGVFTFCWNYQNAVCTYPKCKFVHATIFEEAEFYRTGILPAHARAHLKRPLPPPPPPEETQQEMAPNFVNPPPQRLSGLDKPMPVISCIPASVLEARSIEEEFRIPRSTSPLKREWSELDTFSSSPRDLEPKEHLAKKCKTCDLMEFSLQLLKEKAENVTHASEDVNLKMGLLNKKNIRLRTVLTLIKPAITAEAGFGGIIGGEKDKILEQLNNFVNSSNRLSSVINDDSIKSILGSNMNLTNLMAKLLCSTGDQSLPSDNSRET